MDGSTAVADRMARLCSEAAALIDLDLDSVDGASGPLLHAQLRTVTDQLQAFGARLLARIEDDGRWSAGGSRTFPEWMARQERTSVGAVRREASLGRVLDAELRATAQEVKAGRVTLEHAQVLAQLGPTSEARRAALAGDRPDLNESHLVACARVLPVDQFRREVKTWATKVDAAAAEAEHERACAKEHLTLSRRVDGMAFTGFLTHEHGEALATALRAVGGVPPLGDERSREERQASSLVDLVRLVLDKGLSGGGQQVRPHIVVHVPWESMRRLADDHPAPRADDDHPEPRAHDGTAGGAGKAGAAGTAGGAGTPSAAGELPLTADTTGADLDPRSGPPFAHHPAPGHVPGPGDRLIDPAALQGGEPIPMSLLRRIACDSEISRVVFGPEGAVLDVGRAQRTYSGQQRRAVIARDGSCRYPGCGAPVVLGEVHHVVPWSAGGRTSVENGILLCYHHHDLVHRRHLRVRREAGGWTFLRADGSRLHEEPAEAVPRASATRAGPDGSPARAAPDPSRPRPEAA